MARVLVLTLMVVTEVAVAQEPSERVRGEIADRLVDCAAYFQVLEHCISQPGDSAEGKVTAEKFRALAQGWVALSGELVPPKTALAKHQLSLKETAKTIEDDCGNISFLMVKHEYQCSRLAKEPEFFIEDITISYADMYYNSAD